MVNAYVQVGRAIAWVDPSYGPVAGHPDPMFGFNAVLTAVTSSLQQVFGD